MCALVRLPAIRHRPTRMAEAVLPQDDRDEPGHPSALPDQCLSILPSTDGHSPAQAALDIGTVIPALPHPEDHRRPLEQSAYPKYSSRVSVVEKYDGQGRDSFHHLEVKHGLQGKRSQGMFCCPEDGSVVEMKSPPKL